MKKDIKWPLKSIVEVDWVDSCSNQGWAPLQIHKKESLPSLCRTVGYLLESNKHMITVAQSQSTSTSNVADTMSIPKPAILKVRKVK